MPAPRKEAPRWGHAADPRRGANESRPPCFLRNAFETSVKINHTMPQMLEVMFKRIFAGWAVVLSDGSEIARFRGPFARARAHRLVFR
jgi:hypothetical protein